MGFATIAELRRLAAVACSGLALSQLAQAQEAASDKTATVSGLEEIVVTATKRETNLQDTPIAISVMNAEALEDRHVQSLLDLADGSVDRKSTRLNSSHT